MRVDATSHRDATERIVAWARAGEGRSVCIASVNNVMEAHDDPSFLRAMDGADLVTPDGMPLVWGLRRLGVSEAQRVSGADLVPHVLGAAASEALPIAIYGGHPAVVDRFVRRVETAYPRLRISHVESPPFASLAWSEQQRAIGRINASGARIVLVALGCPKQERWLAASRDRLQAVTIGVGAALDFVAGSKRRAPLLLQRIGLEWAFRLACEPRRLWRRYARHNPRFVILFARQLLREMPASWRGARIRTSIARQIGART
jgi:N-acetylglucosaminyldiphosphoundecaprenol N-acetyl-beta-D-mannosaminyltransferase